MKILVVNAGSSSLKYQLIDMDTEMVLAKGDCEKVAQDDSFLVHKAGNNEAIKFNKKMKDHKDAFNLVLEALLDKEYGVINSIDEINGVGHRVLHSGGDFNKSVLITNEVIRKCELNTELAPLHMPASNDCIKLCRSIMPSTPMVIAFDTSFHSTMPKKAFLYSIPYEAYEKWKIRRYGFHGTSHRYVSALACEYLNNKDAKVITCHLGNGASMAAVKAGICIDTTMGLTPLEGLTMGTRSGDIDPAAIQYLMKKKDMNIDEALDYLNKESGMLGISGISNDNRDLEVAANSGNERAKLALDIFSYKVTRYIGAFAAVLGGVDSIVFTGGIGENSVSQRETIMQGLEFLGAKIDLCKNKLKAKDKVNDISAPHAKVRTLVIPTNEELVIARDTKDIILGLKKQ